MTPEQEATVVEAVARAICGGSCLLARVFDEPCIDPETQRNGPCAATCNQLMLSGLRSTAVAAIAAHTRALEGVGLVIVPVEPTEAMLAAYGGALKAHIEAVPEADRKWRKRRTFSGMDGGYKIRPDEKARCRWQAMIAAAPPQRDDAGVR